MFAAIKKNVPIRLQIAFGWAVSGELNDGVDRRVAMRSITHQTRPLHSRTERRHLFLKPNLEGNFSLNVAEYIKTDWQELSHTHKYTGTECILPNVTIAVGLDVIKAFNKKSQELASSSARNTYSSCRSYYPLHVVAKRFFHRTQHDVSPINQPSYYFEKDAYDNLEFRVTNGLDSAPKKPSPSSSGNSRKPHLYIVK
jgi:hypothetical protein